MMSSEKEMMLENTVSAYIDSLMNHCRYSMGEEWEQLSKRDLFQTTALAVRDRLIDRMIETEERYRQSNAKRLYYLSMEFLMGRTLGNSLINLNAYDACKDALLKLGVDLEEVRDTEPDAALGNGGLGRLAACFLDSLAMLDTPLRLWHQLRIRAVQATH